ncbi:DUF397 domain-containing protein [Streptomyces aurantiacus]|uniref:DUF397 domain-containing protein n=1 Tax=Streptomyces aurantiacus TaxID=47760 RepID=UPI000997568B|nr:DUF397 domain-containing protein [Streptomyces aurantiacus]
MSTDLNWFKSSYSGSQGGECLEVARSTVAVHIRDSKTPDGPTVTIERATWTAFLAPLSPLGSRP